MLYIFAIQAQTSTHTQGWTCPASFVQAFLHNFAAIFTRQHTFRQSLPSGRKLL